MIELVKEVPHHRPAVVNAVLRSVVRSSSIRPRTARAAAAHFRASFGRAVLGEVRWAFAPPRAWLVGVEINLALSLLWLLVQPVDRQAHRDWVVLVGTYFASFILADVTTTNVLGLDAVRVRTSLRGGAPLWRVLVAKNLALLLIVGLPTLVMTAVLTLLDETGHRLAVTLPDVVLPIASWLGVGNIVSVLLPVAYAPLLHRWRHRHRHGETARWLIHLAVPYALFYLVDPAEGVPRILLRLQPAESLGPNVRSVVHAAIGVTVWLLGTSTAVGIARVRGVRIR